MSASALPPLAAGAERDILCPACRQPCKYGPSNAWRPFCSSRCRAADFGSWANERFRVPAAGTPDDEATDALGATPAPGVP